MQNDAQHLIESIPLCVILTDLNGQIIDMNAQALALIGLNKGQLQGQSLGLVSRAENSVQDTAALETVKRGKRATPYIRELVNEDGSFMPVEAHVGPVMTGDKVMGAVFLLRELSDEMKLLQNLQRRNVHLLASSEVARAATQILDYQELLNKCVDLIRTHFGFYYAAIFLIDGAGEWAVLRAATGEGGKQLLDIGHKLGVGSQSMVGWVTANNAPRIALDVGEEAIRFNNPYLPKTRAEMALPLRVRGEVIGALDVQSTSINAFSEEDIQTIQMMADQVAIAIDNARLFGERSKTA